MLGLGRRRQQERDEFLMMHSKIAAIHGDLLRRDEELISALTGLTEATAQVGDRLKTDTTLAEVLDRMLATRDDHAIDLTAEPRVVGGSVSPEYAIGRPVATATARVLNT